MNRLLVRRTFNWLSKPFSVKQLQRWSGQHFIIPLYHLVSNNPSPLVKHLYPVATVDHFKKDLDFLLQHFEPADFGEVVRFAKTKSYRGKPKFFLTFDDGLSECFNVVRQVLKERGLTAAFFINPAFIDNTALAHRQKVSLLIESAISNTDRAVEKEAGLVLGTEEASPTEIITGLKKCTIADLGVIDRMAQVYKVDFDKALNEYRPYMNLKQIKKLVEEGFIVGSHSYSHPEYNQVSEAEMRDQILKSFQYLDAAVGKIERIFSFPFHDIDVPLSFYQFLQDEAGVIATFGTSGMKYDNAPGSLQRIPVEVKGLTDAEAIIRTEYFYYLGKALFGKNRIIRK